MSVEAKALSVEAKAKDLSVEAKAKASKFGLEAPRGQGLGLEDNKTAILVPVSVQTGS